MGKKACMLMLVLLLLSSCSGSGSRTATSAQATASGPPPAPAFAWQIVTYNFATSQSQVYDLESYPWGAGTLSNGGAWLNFPSYPSDSQAANSENVVRLWRVYTQPQSLSAYSALNLSVSVQTQGTPEFFWRTQSDDSVECNPPAARPMLFQWYEGAFVPTDEWWSINNPYPLANGSAVLSIPFTPDQWLDENGQGGNVDSNTQAQFELSLSQMHGIGVSFGGGCNYGHGISVVGGQATFSLSSLAPPPLD
jgi:hypothetical protein